MNYYECKYCLKKFKSQTYYNKHECDLMKKYKLLGTNQGIVAFDLYCKWQTFNSHKTPTHEQFVDSRYFVSFFKFVEFSRQKALPGIDKFIRLMIDTGIQPKDWRSKLVYEYYLKEFDSLFSPTEQVEMTIITIFELARIFECETSEIFLYLNASTLIRLFQAKKLSPWFLLNSVKFRSFMQHEMTREQKILLENYIKPNTWSRLIRDNPKTVENIRQQVKTLGL